MHIDKNSGDFNEENFISCILENTEIFPTKSNAKSTSTIENESTVINTDRNDAQTKQMNDIIEETSKYINQTKKNSISNIILIFLLGQ